MRVMVSIWLVCAVVSMLVARGKNRSWVEGLLLGLAFGVIGVLIETGLPPKSPAD